jgi:sugar phosphate permease
MNLLISFLFLVLYIAIILFIAYVILYIVRDWFQIAIDPMVMKFGKIIVALICLIAIVIWIAGALGHMSFPVPRF